MRYFLIDKVTNLDVEVSASGVKCVTLTDEVIHDHFPDYPLLPGSLLVEGMAQLAGFLLEMSFNTPDKPTERALLVQIDKAKFHSTAGPGDRVAMEVTLDGRAGSAFRVAATATIDDRLVARAKLTFSMQAVESKRVHDQRRYLYALWTRDLDLGRPIL